jgi:hypothetical protein
VGHLAAGDRPYPKGAELGPLLETIERALRSDQALMIEAE